MKNTGIRSLAQNLQDQGRGRDTILAHIMPEEAAMLKRMGGSGTVNPRTGLLEFDNPGMGSYDPGGGDVSGGADTSSWGGGNFVTNGGNGNDGGGMAAGRAADRASVPNYSADSSSGSVGGGGGGFNSANWGVGGGMLTAGTPTMVSSGGGNFVPSGGNGNLGGFMGGLGVPTLVSNAWNSISSSVGNFFTPTPAPPPLVDDMGNQYHINSWGQKVVDKPSTLPAIDYASAAGDLRLLSPKGLEVAQPQRDVDVPPSPTSTANAYNFAPNSEALANINLAMQQQSVADNNALREELGINEVTSGMRFPDPENPADVYGTRGIGISGIPVPQPRPVELSVASASAPPGFRSGAADSTAAQPAYDLAQTSGIAGLRSEAVADATNVAPTTEVPKTLVEYDPVKMQGTYVVDVAKALNTFRPELQGFGTLASDQKLYDNVLGSLTGNETFKQSGSTVTTSEEKLPNGLPATITINAVGPETVMAMGAPKTPVAPEDENASYLTNYPAPSSFTTTASLQVPVPPERSVFGPEAGQVVPEMAVAEAPTAKAPEAPRVEQNIPQFADFNSVGPLLDATFATLTDTGVPTKSVSLPGQREIDPMAYAMSYPQGITYQAPTMVAQVRQPEDSTPRPPAEIPQTVTPTAPIQVASLLDDEFDRIVSGNGRRDEPYRKDEDKPTTTTDTETEPEPETPPPTTSVRPTTGMDLTRQVYVPRPVSTNTTSPAYS